MDIVNTVATMSTITSMSNAKQDISISLLKDIMNQSEENIMKLMSMPTLTPPPSGTTVDYTV
nr:putative motility protein [uncultured Tyzzerella sp.]